MSSKFPRLRRLRKRIVRLLLCPLEVVLVGFALLVIPRLPRSCVLGFARFIGRLSFWFGSTGNRRIRANLRAVYGDTLDEKEIRRITREVWNHSALVMLDFFWFRRRTQERIRKYVSIDDSLVALSRGTKGCLGVTAHLGNWEVVAHAMCVNGRRMTSVFAPVDATRFTQRALLSSREASGQRLVPKHGAILHLLRALREGDIVGLLLDQFTATTEGGMFVDLLGLPAPISRIAGTLHCRLRCEIHVCMCLHEGNGHYRAVDIAILPSDSTLSEDEVTQWIADRFSEAIRRNPEQWLWMYRRWRHIKPGTDPALYPYYAHPYNPLVD